VTTIGGGGAHITLEEAAVASRRKGIPIGVLIWRGRRRTNRATEPPQGNYIVVEKLT
jgi:hypothetical protein